MKLEIKNEALLQALTSEAESSFITPETLVKEILQQHCAKGLVQESQPHTPSYIRERASQLGLAITNMTRLFEETYDVSIELESKEGYGRVGKDTCEINYEVKVKL
jgi:hypothetical protein